MSFYYDKCMQACEDARRLQEPPAMESLTLRPAVEDIPRPLPPAVRPPMPGEPIRPSTGVLGTFVAAARRGELVIVSVDLVSDPDIRSRLERLRTAWDGERPLVLDDVIDGVTLRTLLEGDEFNRREHGSARWWSKPMTPSQRAAVSAHWSAQLRALQAATRERERCAVVADDAARGLTTEDL